MNKFNGVCILPGGSWLNSHLDYFCTYFCLRDFPNEWNDNRGFRCVSPVNSPTVQRFVRIA